MQAQLSSDDWITFIAKFRILDDQLAKIFLLTTAISFSLKICSEKLAHLSGRSIRNTLYINLTLLASLFLQAFPQLLYEKLSVRWSIPNAKEDARKYNL